MKGQQTVIDALNRLYRLGLEPRDRFKLALLATIVLSPRASGGDVAACTFGGWLRYSSPDRAALGAVVPGPGVGFDAKRTLRAVTVPARAKRRPAVRPT